MTSYKTKMQNIQRFLVLHIDFFPKIYKEERGRAIFFQAQILWFKDHVKNEFPRVTNLKYATKITAGLNRKGNQNCLNSQYTATQGRTENMQENFVMKAGLSHKHQRFFL